MIVVQDQLNRTIELKDNPTRIISLVPSQSELLFDLGLEESIIGITKFCVHPNHIRDSKTIVGGTKQIHLDRIKKLNPDIILCNKEENSKELVEACEKICAVHVSDIYTINDSLELIGQYGILFDCQIKAKEISNSISTNLKDFKKFIADKPQLKVAYFIWKNPWMVAANTTFINYLLDLNKFENVFGDLERYPEIDLDNAALKSVDIVMLSSEPFPFKEQHIQEVGDLTNDRTVLVDGEYFSWYGSRLAKAFLYFKNFRLKLDQLLK